VGIGIDSMVPAVRPADCGMSRIDSGTRAIYGRGMRAVLLGLGAMLVAGYLILVFLGSTTGPILGGPPG
jgi:hypothetical protein